MLVAGDAGVGRRGRFITGPTPPPRLTLTRCDKMQNAVKRKAEKKGRKEGAVII